MDCVGCGSTAVTERPDLTVQGYHRFRCRDCGKQFNERSDGVLNRASLPSDVIAFVVFCRLRYRLTLRDLSEIMQLAPVTLPLVQSCRSPVKLLRGKGRRRARSSALHQKIDAPIPFTFNANGDHAELTFHRSSQSNFT